MELSIIKAADDRNPEFYSHLNKKENLDLLNSPGVDEETKIRTVFKDFICDEKYKQDLFAIACKYGSIKFIDFIINKYNIQYFSDLNSCININISAFSQNFLMIDCFQLACAAGQIKIIKYLKEIFNLNLKDILNNSKITFQNLKGNPFNVATIYNQIEVIRTLVDIFCIRRRIRIKKIFNNRNDFTPLHVACSFGKKEILYPLKKIFRLQLKDARIINSAGLSAMDSAIVDNNLEMIFKFKRLFKLKTKELGTKDCCCAPIQCYFRNKKWNFEDFLKLEKKFKFKYEDVIISEPKWSNYNTLAFATAKGKEEFLKYLCHKYSLGRKDMLSKFIKGFTPLHYALETGSSETIKILKRDYGLKREDLLIRDDAGYPALYSLSYNADETIIETLIDEFDIPLDYFIQYHHVNLYERTLIKHFIFKKKYYILIYLIDKFNVTPEQFERYITSFKRVTLYKGTIDKIKEYYKYENITNLYLEKVKTAFDEATLIPVSQELLNSSIERIKNILINEKVAIRPVFISENCCICLQSLLSFSNNLENLSPTELEISDCGHVIHNKCHDLYFSKGKSAGTCPICRSVCDNGKQLLISISEDSNLSEFIFSILIKRLDMSYW